jgi:ammonia channel protein AmtB
LPQVRVGSARFRQPDRFVRRGLAPLSVELLELRLKMDDPGGSISVHAVGGIGNLLFTQLAGVATLVGSIACCHFRARGGRAPGHGPL